MLTLRYRYRSDARFQRVVLQKLSHEQLLDSVRDLQDENVRLIHRVEVVLDWGQAGECDSILKGKRSHILPAMRSLPHLSLDKCPL